MLWVSARTTLTDGLISSVACVRAGLAVLWVAVAMRYRVTQYGYYKTILPYLPRFAALLLLPRSNLYSSITAATVLRPSCTADRTTRPLQLTITSCGVPRTAAGITI